MAITLAPQNVDRHTWYYEERKGLLVVREVRGKDGYVCTEQFVIPWKMVAASVKRREIAKRKKP